MNSEKHTTESLMKLSVKKAELQTALRWCDAAEESAKLARAQVATATTALVYALKKVDALADNQEASIHDENKHGSA